MIFITNKHGIEKALQTKQKVECSYYFEHMLNKEAYKRKWWQLFDKPFTPVKLGVIVGDAGIHPYWLGENNKEQYLFVQFKEYVFAKAIPISCIKDAKQSSEDMAKFLNQNEHRIGEKGFDILSFNTLKQQMEKSKVY